MRFLSCLAFAAGAVGLMLACSSSSDGTPNGTSPEGGSSNGGSSGGTSGTSSSGTSGTSGSGGVDANEPKYVNTTTESVDHQGTTRKYILSIPVDYDATKKYPVYMWLHGNPGTAESAASFRVDRVTKSEAIVVYPGAIDSGGWDHGATLADNVDSTFILAVIDAVAKKANIDKGRILLSGWSGGGFMASAMACRFSSTFRAIGVHAGGAPYDANNPNTVPACNGASIATLVTHGENDTTVDFSGGQYAGQYWSEHNGCNGTKSASTPAPCQTYDGCPAAKPVKTCFIPGLGHPLWDKAIEVEWAWFKALP